MKTFTKLVATIATICICLGLVIAVIALTLGATWNGLGWYGVNFGWRGFGWGASGTESFSASYEGVTSLDFDLGLAEVTVKEGDSFSIDAQNLPTKITSKVENGVWVINTESSRPHNFFGFHSNDAVVTITLPKDFVAEELTLELGMGSLKSDLLWAKKITMDVGMGDLRVKKLISSTLSLKCGMGNIDISQAQTSNALLDCGMGNIDMTVLGAQEDYGYNAKVGVGSVTIGSQKLAGLGGRQSHNTGAAKMLDVECGMGSITIQFE